MIAAAPRKNVNGDTSIRPYRIGIEFLHPRLGLLLEQRYRVRTFRRRLPPAVAGPRRVPTRRPAAGDPVLDGQPLPPPR